MEMGLLLVGPAPCPFFAAVSSCEVHGL